ncbi:HlyD family secretion protein [Pseudomonas sp. NFR16]|uniref:HlyD family secretion protein n=1 Tax=Pseudomonas sp. NFR16 TaxID=1566248 RepID=UPI000B826216|nr:HlyD family secretion protein [Pseudomonas sp. NFR16]
MMRSAGGNQPEAAHHLCFLSISLPCDITMNEAVNPKSTPTSEVDIEQPPKPNHWWLVARCAVVLLAVATVWVFATNWNFWTGLKAVQTTDDAYLESNVIPLSARVSGLVSDVSVNDYQTVHRNDVLVQLYDGDYKAQVAQAKAGLDRSLAQVTVLEKQRAQQEATINANAAGVVASAAGAELRKLEANRQHDLLTRGNFASQQAVDQADASNKQAAAGHVQQQAQLMAVRRALDTIDSQILVAQADVASQRAALDLAMINLDYTHIRSPVDGVVGARQVRPGQYLGIGAQVITVVSLPEVWVVANFKETQMTHVRKAQSATVEIDAFPGVVFHGHVDSWAPGSGSRFALLPPDNATGNFTKVIQRVAVKIVLDDLSSEDANALLRPGLSVIASIDTSSSDNR